jgi:hypothetical protein
VGLFRLRMAPRGAHLVVAARADCLSTCYCLGLVRAQLPEERRAPGGDVGEEVLEGKQVGPKVLADTQVDSRHHSVGHVEVVHSWAISTSRRACSPSKFARHSDMLRRR